MPLSPTAIKRLISLAIPILGFGSYCAYYYLVKPSDLESTDSDEYEGDLEDLRESAFFQKLGGGWDCSYRLFQEFKPPDIDNRNGSELIDKAPTASSSSIEESDSNLVGCLVSDLSYVSDPSKKSGFITWELALRGENRGFIYSGFFSVGKDFYVLDSRTPWESSGMAFEVIKKEEKWEITGGVHWFDFLTFDTFSSVDNLENTTISVSLPNGKSWNSGKTICFPGSSVSDVEKCPFSEKTWTSHRYVGFWEQGGTGKQQVVDAIKIEATEEKGRNKKTTTHKHDIWQAKDFDFSSSNQVFKETNPVKNKLAWNTALNDVYIASKKEWQEIDGVDATQYLKTIYKPWAKKKGTWKTKEDFCNNSASKGSNKFSDLCHLPKNPETKQLEVVN